MRTEASGELPGSIPARSALTHAAGAGGERGPPAVEDQLSGENTRFLVSASFHTRNAPGQCQAANGSQTVKR